MSIPNAKGKLRYESPIIVPLREMAKGTGANCTEGGEPAPPSNYCAAGGTTVSGSPGYCEAGTTASPGYCSAGTTAASYCSGGYAANEGGCVNGDANVQ